MYSSRALVLILLVLKYQMYFHRLLLFLFFLKDHPLPVWPMQFHVLLITCNNSTNVLICHVSTACAYFFLLYSNY